MQITLSSVVNTILCTSLMLVLIIITLKYKFLFKRLSFYTIILCFLLIAIRLLFPYEFYFVKEIPVRKVMPQIYGFLYDDVLTLGNFNVSVLKFLSISWITVSIVLLIKFMLDYYKTRYILLNMRSVNDSDIIIALNEVNSKYNKKVSFTLVSSSIISTPLLFGIRKPIIALPQIILTHKELCYIFEHELCHYYKKHLHIKLFCEFITVIYFWNPLIFMIKKLLNKVLEFYVDAKVNENLTEYNKIEYLECLLKIAKLQQTNKQSFFCTVPFSIISSPRLLERGNILLNNSRHRNFLLINKLFLLSALMLTIFSYSFICEPYYISEEYAENTFNADNAYFVLNAENTYDLYVDSVYVSTVTKVFDPKIPIKEE